MNFGLRFNGGPFSWGLPRRPRPQRRQQQRKPGASSGGAAAGESYSARVSGWQGPAKAGLVSGSLSSLGDILAQLLAARQAEASGATPAGWDVARTLRMLGFGLLWYGPYQFYWYNLLDWAMPARTTGNFISKVALNQLALAPVVLAFVFSWNLALTGQGAGIPGKIRRDLVPSMVNGWKFWVPAASINFYAVPLDKQVLYMSACGVLWTAYLSYASANAVGKDKEAPAAAAAPCCSSKGKAKGKDKGKGKDDRPAAAAAAKAAPKACCGGKGKGGGGEGGFRLPFLGQGKAPEPEPAPPAKKGWWPPFQS